MQNQTSSILDQYGKQLPGQRTTDLTEIARIFRREDAANSPVSRPFSSNSWIYSIINSIAQSLTEASFGLYRPSPGSGSGRFSNKNWVPVNNDPLIDLLEFPNPWQTQQRFIEQWCVYLLAGGNVWAWKDENSSHGIPRSLLLFGPGQVQPLRAKLGQPPRAWTVTKYDGTKVNIPLDDMIHWMMPNELDQFMGMAPWMAMRLQIDADFARVTFDKSFFRNNATPDSVLTYKPGPLNESARELIREAWMEAHGGADQGGGIAVLGGDFDLKVLGISHSQAQYIEARDFTRQEAASVYNYPVQLLNDVDGGGLGRDQLTVARILKHENAVAPAGRKFQDGIDKGLVRDFARKPNTRSFFDYDGLSVMVDIMSTKIATFENLTANGISINSAIAKLDLGFDPVDGGDVSLVPSRSQTLATTTLKEDAIASTISKTKQEIVVLKRPPVAPAPIVVAPEDDAKKDDAKKDAPVKKKAIPAKTGKAEQKSNFETRATELAPVFAFAGRKVKRVLFGLRNEAFKNVTGDSPFNLDKARKNWADSLLAPCTTAAELGIRGGFGISIIDDNLIQSFKDKINTANLNEDEFLSVINKQIDHSFRLIGKLWTEIRNSDLDRERQIGDSFNEIMRVSRLLAIQQVIWAYNWGVYSGNLDRKLNVYSPKNNCEHGGSYPGDPTTHSHTPIGCWCMVMTEE